MFSFTTPYKINPTLSSKCWKTEHTSNFISTEYIVPHVKKTKRVQIKKPFSQYKIIIV